MLLIKYFVPTDRIPLKFYRRHNETNYYFSSFKRLSASGSWKDERGYSTQNIKTMFAKRCRKASGWEVWGGSIDIRFLKLDDAGVNDQPTETYPLPHANPLQHQSSTTTPLSS
jgi:hypothetical protein